MTREDPMRNALTTARIMPTILRSALDEAIPVLLERVKVSDIGIIAEVLDPLSALKCRNVRVFTTPPLAA